MGLLVDLDCAWACSKCGQPPQFTRRQDWGFNMADAVCVTPTCPGGSFRAAEVPSKAGKNVFDYPYWTDGGAQRDLAELAEKIERIKAVGGRWVESQKRLVTLQAWIGCAAARKAGEPYRLPKP